MIYTDEDSPAAWLHAGQALSAIVLAAQVDGLGGAPISDITEVGATRDDLRRLLPGLGHPRVCVRWIRTVRTSPTHNPSQLRRIWVSPW